MAPPTRRVRVRSSRGRSGARGRRTPRPPRSMWKLSRGRVLLDEPPEEEDGLRGGPSPAAAQVRGAQVGPGPRPRASGAGSGTRGGRGRRPGGIGERGGPDRAGRVAARGTAASLAEASARTQAADDLCPGRPEARSGVGAPLPVPRATRDAVGIGCPALARSGGGQGDPVCVVPGGSRRGCGAVGGVTGVPCDPAGHAGRPSRRPAPCPARDSL